MVATAVSMLIALAVCLWLYWPRIAAVREVERIRLETLRATAQSRHLAQAAALHLMAEARRVQQEDRGS